MSDKPTGTAQIFLKELMPYLEQNGWIATSFASEITGKPLSTVRRHLRKLMQQGVLDARGANKNRQYRLSRKAESKL